MKKLLVAALLISGPGLAIAQVAGPNNSMTQPLPPQTNLQAQGGQTMQPPNAQSVDRGPSLGQADAIPNPTFGSKMTPVPQPPKIGNQDPLK
jgi:hypothetical protein